MYQVLLYDGITATGHQGKLQVLGQGMISIDSPSLGSKIYKLSELDISSNDGLVMMMAPDLQIEISAEDFKHLKWKKDHRPELQMVFKMMSIAFSIFFALYIFRAPLRELISQHVVDPMLTSAGEQLKQFVLPLNCMSHQQKKIFHALFQRMNKNIDEYHLVLKEDPELNAFAMPGNIILINSALLKQGPGPEALAGVLAHEISHLELKHLNNKIMKDYLVQFAFTVMFHQFKNTGLIQEFTKGYFSQIEETEADQAAAVLLKESSIDPKGMVVFFQKLQKQAGGLDAFAISHPGYAGRINTFSGHYKSLPVMSVDDWSVIQAGCVTR